MKYLVAERFKSIQGEGINAGVPMAFIRFVGCSVGKKICQHCDTDFDKVLSWRGGGEYTAAELLKWAQPFEHICLTGGEPLDQDLGELIGLGMMDFNFNIETSGTKYLPEDLKMIRSALHICVSPKPGFIEDVVLGANEIKIIVDGLGTQQSLDQLRLLTQGNGRSWHPLAYDSKDRFSWPTLEDAIRWAEADKIVYLQPRNGKFEVDQQNLRYVLDLLQQYPQFRLSTQMHKILRVQ